MLALKLNKIVHDRCKEVPHDIGLDLNGAVTQWMSKSWIKLPDIENNKVQLCVYECACGFHIGLDFTYIDQCEDIVIACPSCRRILDTSKVEDK